MNGKIGLQQQVESVPGKPGVYLYRDGEGRIVYIGKAKNLRSRVRSYFLEARDRDPKTERLVQEIRDLEFIVTGSEYEAFILESNLVRAHQPRYNICLKDDKAFPQIRLTVAEPFPRIGHIRRPIPDGSRYFGPFIPASRCRLIIDTVRRFFGIRYCRSEIDGSASRPCCLDYQLGKCLGPCVSSICSPERYQEAVRSAILFLEGKTAELLARLRERMAEAAGRLSFEEAALLRDRVRALESLREDQQVIIAGENDTDVFGVFHRGRRLALQVFHLHGSKVVDRRHYHWDELPEMPTGRFLGSFLRQFYLQAGRIAPRICLPVRIEEEELTRRWRAEQAGRRVTLLQPKRGPAARLLKLVNLNARIAFFNRFPAEEEAPVLLESLRSALGLTALPRRIEAFDISNTQGTQVVGSMVCAEDGRLAHGGYRRFKVRLSEGCPDDFAAMREVVFRRLSRLVKERKPLPQLVMVDGGAGQVSAARQCLVALGLEESVELIGLAKREEEIYRSGHPETLKLPRNSPALRFLQRLRDEAHRTAVRYHRQQRQTRSFSSALPRIPGIGPRRRQLLLKRFGGLEHLQTATAAELEAVLGPRLGQTAHRHLHPNERSDDEA